ncbi:hypothetical protein B0H66DRAFT_266292 [Apodospora peruviana]|uniref:Uncharacterized protein n=1 Tax=Apodospora peruviana TaxID=516989 RepID=A0AAE0I6E9_9PEZI|nr:hypothetical protein B0H66DRAFT_266292 [Apodospora peruviana]
MNDKIFKFAALGQATVALIFILIALTGGRSANYLESVNIISFNMTGLGQNLVPDPSAASNPIPKGKDCGGGLLGKVCDGAGDAFDKVQGAAGDAVDAVTGFAKDKLGIKDYYSIHLTDLCQGDFNKDRDPLIESCTTPFKTDEMNIIDLLTEQVKAAGIDLEKLGFVKELNDAFDKIPKFLAATGYFFVTVCVFLVLCGAATAAAAVLSMPIIGTVALGLAGLTWLIALIGVLILTVVQMEVKSKVNEKGNKIGIFASSGGVLLFLVWTGIILLSGNVATLFLASRSSAPTATAPPVQNEKDLDMEIGNHSTPGHSGEFDRGMVDRGIIDDNTHDARSFHSNPYDGQQDDGQYDHDSYQGSYGEEHRGQYDDDEEDIGQHAHHNNQSMHPHFFHPDPDSEGLSPINEDEVYEPRHLREQQAGGGQYDAQPHAR